METKPPDINEILKMQKEILPDLKRSHRLFLGTIYNTILSLPLWILWIYFIFIASIASIGYVPTLQDFAILLILSPLFAFFIYLGSKQFKSIYDYLRYAEECLKEAEKATSISEITLGISTYIHLLFNVTKPPKLIDDTEPDLKVEEIRKRLRTMKSIPLMEFLSLVLVITGLAAFVAAEPAMLAIVPVYWLLGILSGLMTVRWVVFYLWNRYANRWIKLYSAIMAWGQELEQMLEPPHTGGGGEG